jgi:preprotein translocase subunit SecE
MAMNMNREQKRQLRRMGAVNEDGNPVRVARQAPAQKAREPRTPPRQFLREVRGELRKVAWPTRPEVKNMSIIVLITVVVFTSVVFGLDLLAGKMFLWMFRR